MTAWKDLERRVCAALGGRRAGPQGAAVSDCIGVPFAVEVKRCKTLHILGRWIEQSQAQGKNENKPWLLVVGNHNTRFDNLLVTHTMADFLANDRRTNPEP